MEITAQPQLKFLGIDIFNVHFVAQKPSIGVTEQIELTLIPRVVHLNTKPPQFKIAMNARMFLKEYFELTLDSVGTFELSGDATEEVKKAFVNQNAPAIMFPYIRSFVTTFSSSLGGVTGPLYIPIQFFKGEVEELVPAKALEK
jgi:preprotein translocase subunit SecB